MGDVRAERAAALERIAVGLSFWLGGLGLATIKGFAYVLTGSTLVRTSLFDSIGDTFSSAIMAITSSLMNSTNPQDAQRYPVGKARFAPLGVLFFCAFMCSSMSSMAVDSAQTLLSSEDPNAAATEAAAAAMRRLFQEKPRLRFAYGPGRNLDALVREYSIAGAGDGQSDDGGVSNILLGTCVAAKLFLYFFCRGVDKLQGSEIVKALAADHRNDIVVNILVIGTMGFVSTAERWGFSGAWMAKIDPLVSLLLSVWIVYGWVTTSLEQLKALSDRQADREDVDVDALEAAARGAVQDLPVEIRGLDVYHAGDGFRARVDLRPGKAASAAGPARGEVERLATGLQRLRTAVRSAGGSDAVLAVETCLYPQSQDQSPTRGKASLP